MLYSSYKKKNIYKAKYIFNRRNYSVSFFLLSQHSYEFMLKKNKKIFACVIYVKLIMALIHDQMSKFLQQASFVAKILHICILCA